MSDDRLRLAAAHLQPQLADGQAIKVIGLGGVGSIVARFGAMFLAPLTADRSARLVLIDGDSFEPSNATRMFFPSFGNKATVVRDGLRDHFSESRLEITAIEEYVTHQNVSRLLHGGDIVLACVDNHATRKLLSDFCAASLADVVLISGGNDGIGADASGRVRHGTYGNCQVYIRSSGEDRSPSLTRYHAEIQKPVDRLPTDQSCTEMLISTPQLLLANFMAGSAILNALWLHLCGALHYSELAFDIAEGLMRPLAFPSPNLRDSSCRVPLSQ
jgi:hypothetical protein